MFMQVLEGLQITLVVRRKKWYMAICQYWKKQAEIYDARSDGGLKQTLKIHKITVCSPRTYKVGVSATSIWVQQALMPAGLNVVRALELGVDM